MCTMPVTLSLCVMPRIALPPAAGSQVSSSPALKLTPCGTHSTSTIC